MKVGILTFHRSNNYGAMLQAYALQTVLRKLHIAPTFIDYSRSSTDVSIFAPWSTWKNVIINCFALLMYPKSRRRIQRFQSFRNELCHISAESYDSCNSLKSIVDKYDAFVCGSDQIWRDIDNYDRTKVYFLAFANKANAKIAYAPSFGVSSISDSFKQIIKPFIDDIQHLSVREETGKRIISKTTGRKAEVVLDPTLLLNRTEWLGIAAPLRMKKPYILVYCLSQKRDFCNLVRHIKSKAGLPVVVISASALSLIPEADHIIYDASPEEFVGLFANASCVCTNSFHGTAFSIINRRPFWTTPHNVANSRIADLLQKLELSEHQVAGENKLPESPLEIDYSKAEIMLDKAKKKSINFLKDALSCD